MSYFVAYNTHSTLTGCVKNNTTQSNSALPIKKYDVLFRQKEIEVKFFFPFLCSNFFKLFA